MFNAQGLGDVDLTARVQLNPGDYSKPFWIGWLRYKWATGKDPFEVVTDCVDRCVANTTGTGLPLELPTGSGFDAAQAGLTWLYAADPAVFFGGLSYLYDFPRENVSRTLLQGEAQFLGKVEPGAVRTTPGTLLLGVSYRYNPQATLNLSLGVGVTRDTPDVTFTLRTPITF